MAETSMSETRTAEETSQTPGPSKSPSRLSTILGSVVGKRKRGRPAKLKVISPSVPESPISGTSVTDMVGTMTLEKSLSSSTSVPSTIESSSSSTVWQMSPNGYVENGLSLNIDDLLAALPESTRQTLLELAKGRSEDVSTTVDEICRFLCESESDFAEAPLPEAITYYLSVSQI